MIEILSVADADIPNLREGTLVFDCNTLPALAPLSGLRKELGNDEQVVRWFTRMPIGRALIQNCVGQIVDDAHRFVAFSSQNGEYRSPAIATAVGNELCERGCRVFLTHLKVNVPAEELVPTRKTWGYQ